MLGMLTLLSSRVLICELGQVIDILVYNNVQIVGSLMRRDVCSRETLRHLVEQERRGGTLDEK
jgi:hypothetical protein